MSPYQIELISLMQQWASHFGYLDGKIDINLDPDLAAFATSKATLTAHAPLWGTKPGKEKAVLATEVRKTLGRLLKFVKLERHQMHMGVHDKQLCLYFQVKGRLKFFPLFYVLKVSLVFVVTTVDTPKGLRFHEIHEWPVSSPKNAQKVMIENYSWLETSKLEKYVAFGALS